MASPTELMGAGVPAQVADLLGGEPSVLTCAGTAQADGATVKSKNTELSAASSQTGALLQASPIDAPYHFFCSSSTSAVVYPPVDDYMNGVQNDSVTIAQYGSAIIWQYKKGYWASK